MKPEKEFHFSLLSEIQFKTSHDLMSENPNMDEMLQLHIFLFFIYCKKGEVGDKKEARTNTLIIKDKILC